jgi:hypothetical protein
MKKIMFILAFVGIGLFASASNGKGNKIKSSEKKTIKTKLEKPLKNDWMAVVNCPNGLHITSCCYSSQTVALGMAHYIYESIC